MKPRQKTRLIKALRGPEYRHAFFSSLISTSIAAQLRANRKHRGWSQTELGDRAGMFQSRISALEDVNYQRWTIKTLKRLAEALDLVLSVRFESFNAALRRLEHFQDSLVEPSFAEDIAIHGYAVDATEDLRRPRIRR